MEGFEGIVALVLAVLGLMALRSLPGMAGWRDSDDVMSTVARKLGLRPPAAESARGVLFEGVVDGYRVTLESEPLTTTLCIVVHGDGKIAHVLRLGNGRLSAQVHGPDRVASRAGRSVEARTAVVRRDHSRVVLALPGWKGRMRVASAVRDGELEVHDGKVIRQAEAVGSALALEKKIRQTVRLADALARQLLPACQTAALDPDPRRCLDAVHLLRAVATDEHASTPLAVEALQRLGCVADQTTLSSSLMQLARTGEGEARLLAVETLGELRHRPSVGLLVGLLGDADHASAAAAAAALGAIGDSSVEGELIRALKSVSVDVQTAAAEALGLVGTAAAVEPLLEAARRSWLPTRLDATVREAIRRIQARTPGADTGQRSLADAGPARGALSVAVEPETAEGALSLTEASQREQVTAPSESGRESAATRSPAAAKRLRDRQGD